MSWQGSLESKLAREGAKIIGAENDSMRRVLARYIRLFGWGALHGVFAVFVDGGSVMSHLFNFYTSDFEWVFKRAFEVVLFLRRDGPVTTSARWVVAVENLLAWSVVFAGYFSSTITLSILISIVLLWISYLNWLERVLQVEMLWLLVSCFTTLFFITCMHEFVLVCYKEQVLQKLLSAAFFQLVPAAHMLVRSVLQLFNPIAQSLHSGSESWLVPQKAFVYPDIGPGQIRLLRLRRKRPSEILACELFNALLDESGPDKPVTYQAISYTWGTEEPTCSISLNGYVFKVRPNVYELLNNRRSWTNTPVLWIDSICINQEDTSERNSQVPLMKEIYERATDVLIWLGTASDAGLAVRQIATLYLQTNAVDHTASLDGTIRKLWDRQKRSRFNDASLRALAEMFSHNYWERTWIVQEIAAAARLSVCYGGYSVSWESYQRVVNFFADSTRGEAMLLLASPASVGSSLSGLINVPGMERMRRAYARGERRRLDTLLRAHIKYKAKDPRDKIYALQGISRDPQAVVVDYDREVGDVYLDAACYLLKQETLVDTLQYAGIGWNPVALDPPGPITTPSWVPNWSQPRTLESLACSGANYKTSSWDRASIALYPDNIISPLGVIIDELVDFTAPFSPSTTAPAESRLIAGEDFYRRATQLYFEAVQLAKEKGADPYPYTSQPLSEAIWRTLVCDRKGQVHPAPASVQADLEFWVGWATRLQSFSAELIKRADSLTQTDITDTQEWQQRVDADISQLRPPQHSDDPVAARRALEVTACLGAFFFERRFCMSKTGYLAIVPPLSQAGDVIAVIHGAETPFVLRPLGRRWMGYTLVGECYTHGLMRGEVEGLENKVTAFDIR